MKAIYKRPFINLAIVVILCTIFGSRIFFQKLDYDIEKFYNSKDTSTLFYKEYQQYFGTDNDFLIIALESDKGILDKDFIKNATGLQSKLAVLDNVTEIVSPYSIEEKIRSPFIGVIETPLVTSNDSLSTSKLELLSNTFGGLYSKDFKTVAIFLKHRPRLEKKDSDLLLEGINGALSEFKFDHVAVGGRIIGQTHYFKLMGGQLTKYVGLSAVITTIVLFLLFRKTWTIIVPTSVVLVSLILTLGLMEMLNEPVNILLTVLPTILFIVGIADSIHFISKYNQFIADGHTVEDAIEKTMRLVGLATFYTSLTTAFGFVSLVFINVEPIQKFGIYTGIGVMLAFLATYLILPAAINHFQLKSYHKSGSSERWNAFFAKFSGILFKRKKIVVGVWIVLVGLSIFQASKLKTNNYLLDDLKSTDPVKEQFVFIDQHLNGVRPLEIAIQFAKDTSAEVSYQEVLVIDKIESELREVFELRSIATIAGFYKYLNRAYHEGNPSKYRIPTEKEFNKLNRFLKKQRLKDSIQSSFYSEELNSYKLSSNQPDAGRLKVDSLTKVFLKNIEPVLEENNVTLRFADTAYLVDQNLDSLVKKVVLGLSLALLMVGVMMGLLYRSLKFALLSLIPNLVPLIMLAGIMAMMGVEMKMTTAIVFTIAFGIAVDDTIHFMSRYRLALKRGEKDPVAVTLRETGKALVLTTIILVFGFSTLILSDFLGTYYMGIFLCLGLLLALIADLTILPLLLSKKEKEPKV